MNHTHIFCSFCSTYLYRIPLAASGSGFLSSIIDNSPCLIKHLFILVFLNLLFPPVQCELRVATVIA